MDGPDLPGDGFVQHLCAPLEDGGDDAWLEVGAYAWLQVGREVRSWEVNVCVENVLGSNITVRL